MLDNVVLKDELIELEPDSLAQMKQRSEEGLVCQRGIGTDLCDYKYVFLDCARDWVSRKRCPDVNDMFLKL